MKYVKKILLFITRSLMLFVILCAMVSKNFMTGLDLIEIDKFFNLIYKYEDLISLPYTQELMIYNMMFKINKYFFIIVIIDIVAWALLEITVIIRKKE